MSLIGSKYVVETSLGRGTFGQVVLARDVETSRRVAIKVCARHGNQFAANIAQEIQAMSRMKHMNIVQLFEVLEDDNNIYIVLEYIPGGELFDYIAAHNRVREKEAREFFGQITNAVHYMHAHNIVHRDLKPENILIDYSHNIKIIDFGLAYSTGPNEKIKGKCGSPHYTSPEMLNDGYYSYSVDIWSLGVILFAVLCGYLPFDDSSRDTLATSITSGHYYVPKWLSEHARDLLHRMLTVDPDHRITAAEILVHPWMKNPAPQPVSLETLLTIVVEEENIASSGVSGSVMPAWQLRKERKIAENIIKRRSVIDTDLLTAGSKPISRKRAASSNDFFKPAAPLPQPRHSINSPSSGFGPLQGPLPPLAEVDEATEQAAASPDSPAFVLHQHGSKPHTGMTEGMADVHVTDMAAYPMRAGPVRHSRSKMTRRMSDTSLISPMAGIHDSDGSLPVMVSTPGSGPTWAMPSPKMQQQLRHGAPSYSHTLPFPESAVSSLKPAEIIMKLKGILERLAMASIELVGPFSIVAITAPDPVTEAAVELQISVYKLSNLAGMHVIVGHRKRGDAWLYCAIFQSIIEAFNRVK